MKRGIGFKNMKVFKDKFTFDFKDITLFTGVNNSGKSSAINGLQLIQESIKQGNLDGILKAEFKTNKNKNKFGSIKTFINNNSNLEDNYFKYYQIQNGIEYSFKIDINEGLESYGKISEVNAKDLVQEVDIFKLEVLTPYIENFSCNLIINYKYYVERFTKKIQNTRELILEIPKLKQLCKDLDIGVKTFEEANKFVKGMSKKYAVSIEIFEAKSFKLLNSKSEKKWTYVVSRNGINSEESYDNEVGILFDSYNNLSIERIFENIDEFDSKYSQILTYGIFDFDKIWTVEPSYKSEFESKITEFYKVEIHEAYLNLSKDLLSILSSTKWTIQENYTKEDPLFLPSNLIEKFINCFEEDYGLIPLMVVSSKTKNETSYGYLDEYLIDAFGEIDFDKPATAKLNNKHFIELLKSLSEILVGYVDKHAFENKKINKNIIQDHVFEKINKEVKANLNSIQIKKNYAFVSSNRFNSSRTHFYEDGTEITHLLNELEKSSSGIKTTCYDFINNWLKEFDIADELVLLPDDETGNFKIYLKHKNKKTLLADFGLGTNQLLPIIFSLCLHRYIWDKEIFDEKIITKTVVIEEPESNLHPSMQSKLAEMFVDATEKFKVKIIAETHSEYLIRKLQHLIAKRTPNLKSENVVIYYFYKSNNDLVKSKKVNQIEKIEIDDFGRLSKEFGGGFFDEADNSALALFLLNQYNKN